MSETPASGVEEIVATEAALQPSVPAAALQPSAPAVAPAKSAAPKPLPPAKPAGAGSASAAQITEVIERFRKGRDLIISELSKVIIGQVDVVDQMLIAMFCRSHCLVVGVPGLAKTLIIRTLSQIFDLQFSRIQFTPDLMPSDIIGTDILEEDENRRRQFKFIKGPIFANLLLADEINRTPPKTQSALLEAMQEYHVTSGGTTYDLPQPFFVLATQNPLEQEGTYPLPEAQLDRFMFMIMIGYPSEAEEIDIVKTTTRDEVGTPRRILDGRQIMGLQRIVRQLVVSDHVVKYATRLTRASRPKTKEAPDFISEYLSWGCGPRAAQYLILGAKARAILNGRVNVSCEDVRSVIRPVFRHRLFTNFNADAEGITVEDIIARLLETVKEPGEKDY
ncbi:MAG: AAA family ATPase [Candidatus Sumerlaeota bacterium]|nr:AAA family ATPase [Candidatus Sumerlaeota bacterium]